MPLQAELTGQLRKEGTHILRRQGRIPAVLYGYKIKNVKLDVDSKQFLKVLHNVGHTSLIKLTIGKDKKEHAVIIREVQTHPVKDIITHVDFYQPRLDQTINANVPLDFVGESPAVKDLSGVLIRTLDEVELEALPTDLPHNIKVDISVLIDFTKTIRVADLQLPPNVKLHHEDDEVIALVQPPRTEEELEALEEEVSEDVEEVEGVEDKEAADQEEGDQSADTEKSEESDKTDDKKE